MPNCKSTFERETFLGDGFETLVDFVGVAVPSARPRVGFGPQALLCLSLGFWLVLAAPSSAMFSLFAVLAFSRLSDE